MKMGENQGLYTLLIKSALATDRFLRKIIHTFYLTKSRREQNNSRKLKYLKSLFKMHFIRFK